MKTLSAYFSKKVLLFILFSFLISWVSSLIIYIGAIKADSFTSIAIIACMYMQGPILSVLIVQKLIYKEPFLKYGLSFKGNSYKWMLHVPLFFLLFIIIYILLCLIFGNALSLQGFGYIDFSYSGFIDKINEISKNINQPQPPELPEITGLLIFSLGIVFTSMFAGFINLPFTLGEEYGWRGLLYEETKKIGTVASNIISGTIWGLWHAPLIVLQGLNYPSYPFIGILFMILFCIALSFLFSALKAKYSTAFAPAMFHGIINGTAGLFLYFQHNSHELIGNITGIGGITAVLITFYILKRHLYSNNSKA